MDILKFSGGSLGFLKKVLDLRSQRHNLIASNIANIDTPKYKTRNIAFEEHMGQFLEIDESKKMAQTDKKHLSAGGKRMETMAPELIMDNSKGGVDGNNVDMDKEMGELAKNSVLYKAATQMLGAKFDLIKYSIDQGGK